MKSDVIKSLAWGVGIVILALAATFARRQGYIDADTTTRIVMAAIGLMVAWFGNRAPKAFLPSGLARRAARFSGWSLAISGLINAGMWAFAPMDMAITLGAGAIAVGLAATVLRFLWLRSRVQPVT